MNISINSVSQIATHFLQNNIVPSLTAYQKKVVAIAVAALAVLALCILACRSFCKAKVESEKSLDLEEKKKSLADKGKEMAEKLAD